MAREKQDRYNFVTWQLHQYNGKGKIFYENIKTIFTDVTAAKIYKEVELRDLRIYNPQTGEFPIWKAKHEVNEYVETYYSIVFPPDVLEEIIAKAREKKQPNKNTPKPPPPQKTKPTLEQLLRDKGFI